MISYEKGILAPGDGEKELHSQEEKIERNAVKSIIDGNCDTSRAEEVGLQTQEEKILGKAVKSSEDVIELSPGEEEKELPSQEDSNKGKAVKRKIDVEKKKKVGERKRDGDFKFKYIGETNRSAYERGKEHLRDFKDLNEGSHILKHYLRHHRNIKINDMKVGMRIRAQYRSAMERQIGEATSILMDQKKGVKLLNSKSEFNRCSLPRLQSGNHKEILKEAKNEEEEENVLNNEIKKMRKEKKEKERKEKEERKRKNPTLEDICKEIRDENRHTWNLRRMDEIKEKKNKEEAGKSS